MKIRLVSYIRPLIEELSEKMTPQVGYSRHLPIGCIKLDEIVVEVPDYTKEEILDKINLHKQDRMAQMEALLISVCEMQEEIDYIKKDVDSLST